MLLAQVAEEYVRFSQGEMDVERRKKASAATKRRRAEKGAKPPLAGKEMRRTAKAYIIDILVRKSALLTAR
jgi:hypothetical protein